MTIISTPWMRPAAPCAGSSRRATPCTPPRPSPGVWSTWGAMTIISTPWMRPTAPCAGSSRRARDVYSSPAISGGVVYVGSEDNYIYALDATNGTLRWKFKTGYSVYSSPAISGGVVYAGNEDNYIYALDAAKGTLRWKFKTEDTVGSSPAVSGGRGLRGKRRPLSVRAQIGSAGKSNSPATNGRANGNCCRGGC